MNTPPITEKPALTWFQRHEKTLAHSAIITGLALIMIAAGIIAVAAHCSTYNPQPNYFHCGDALPTHDMPNDLPDVQQDELSIVMRANLNAGASCVSLIVGGVLITVIASIWRTVIYQQEKNSKEEPTVAVASEVNKMTPGDVKAMKLKLVGLVLGILGAMVGLGMLASSAYILNHNVPDVQNIVQNGLQQYPQDMDFWNGIQTKWLDVTIPHMHALLWGGIFTLAAGGGLAAVALLQAQIRKCFQNTQNTVIES